MQADTDSKAEESTSSASASACSGAVAAAEDGGPEESSAALAQEGSAEQSSMTATGAGADVGDPEECGAAEPGATDSDGHFDAPPAHDPLASDTPAPARAPSPPGRVYENAAFGHINSTPVGWVVRVRFNRH